MHVAGKARAALKALRARLLSKIRRLKSNKHHLHRKLARKLGKLAKGRAKRRSWGRRRRIKKASGKTKLAKKMLLHAHALRQRARAALRAKGKRIPAILFRGGLKN